MVILILLLLAVLWFFFSSRVDTYVSDESLIGKIVNGIRSRRPELVPLETISVDNGVARMMWFDMNNYSGQIIDSTEAGALPRAPPLNQFSPAQKEQYMPYDEIEKFHKQF